MNEENPMIWRAGEDDGNELPKEEEAYEPDQDTPPIARTHEEVLQNLARNGEQNFAEREAVKLGIDFDEDTKDEFNRVNEE